MEGNYNAEKWTEEVVIQTLEKMIQLAQEEQTENVVIKETNGAKSSSTTYRIIRKCIHLKTELLIKLGIWNKDWFNQMAKKFNDSETVSSLLGAIDMLVESNSYKAAADGLSNPIIVKMNLATHHDWSDKQQQQIQSTTKVEVNKPEIEDSEFFDKWNSANNIDEA